MPGFPDYSNANNWMNEKEKCVLRALTTGVLHWMGEAYWGRNVSSLQNWVGSVSGTHMFAETNNCLIVLKAYSKEGGSCLVFET